MKHSPGAGGVVGRGLMARLGLGKEHGRGSFPFLEAGVFAAALLIFGLILLLKVPSDIQEHARYVQHVVAGSRLPPANFAYYLAIYALALFNSSTLALYISSLLVLAAAVTAKFRLTRFYSSQYYKLHVPQADRAPGLVDGLGVALVFTFSWPTWRFYIGQLPPNVWHNSTTIFLMPFAVALFWVSYAQLMDWQRQRTVAITALCLANVMIKPSFFFVFAVAYPLAWWSRAGSRRRRWEDLVPVVVGAATVLLMHYLIYDRSYGNLHQGDSGVALRPLRVWSHFSRHIGFSLLASLVFPIAYVSLHPRDLARRPLLQYAVLCYGIAVAIAALLAETGPREFHGNFFWQAIVCSYLLFMVTAVLFAEKIALQGWSNWRNRIVAAAFFSHVVAGVGYLGRFLYARNYL